MLTDKTVVIIGGSSGIGLATAQRALQEGAKVIIVGRSLEKLTRALEILGADAQSYVADVSKEKDMETLFKMIKQVDHVFVTAAQVVLGNIHETHTELFVSTLNSRVWGAFNVAKYATLSMPKNGSVTFMSGSSTWKPAKGGAIAAAAGGAVEALGRALALELAPIRVNTIAAGVVETPLLDNFFGSKKTENLKHLASSLPVQRVGTADDIAEAAIYLMKNQYSTGTVLAVDGGILLQ